MIPEFVRAVQAVRPSVFVCENVVGMRTKQFQDYIDTIMVQPLSRRYTIRSFCLNAADYGVPQKRRRVFFVGFADRAAASAFAPPPPTHSYCHLGPCTSVRSLLPKTMGAREALGLEEIGTDALAPTIRSGLTGPRHTTSILNSVSALKVWDTLQIWPNGVAENRERAHGYIVQNGHFRLSVADCMVLQGFPENWPLKRPVYFALGMIGNSVAPPMAYCLARAVQAALSTARS
jgi:DNA (cytosine-5)-methyltransferase 1